MYTNNGCMTPTGIHRHSDCTLSWETLMSWFSFSFITTLVTLALCPAPNPPQAPVAQCALQPRLDTIQPELEKHTHTD